MVRVKTLLLSSLSIIVTSSASAVRDLASTNFDATVFDGTPSLVEFFAPWCGHCKKLAPIYDELADSLQHASSKVIIGKVDGDEHKDLTAKYGISGFPTIKWFDGKSKDPQDYTGGRDLESLQSYITEKTGAKPKKAAHAPSAVTMLNDKNFSGTIGGDKDVLVAFTAPWCGHCKTLAPIWETVATDFASDDSVVIAKVDAEANKAVAQEQGVSSYPTIKFFPKGSKTPEDYSGGRDEKSFLSYINEKSGTHRTPGGGLDAMAGTVDALDTILAKMTGSNLATVSEEVKQAVLGTKDKYAEYYVKVLEKLGVNDGYVEKELTRLEGMLKKGGLAPTKLDDLTSRLNILKKFVLGEGKTEL